MNREAIRAAVLESLAQIAPDADASELDPHASLREELDIDSMDFLRYVGALHRALGVEVPERDYGEVDSVGGAVAYIEKRLANGLTATLGARTGEQERD
jgi:acyl carrier protein